MSLPVPADAVAFFMLSSDASICEFKAAPSCVPYAAVMPPSAIIPPRIVASICSSVISCAVGLLVGYLVGHVRRGRLVVTGIKAKKLLDGTRLFNVALLRVGYGVAQLFHLLAPTLDALPLGVKTTYCLDKRTVLSLEPYQLVAELVNLLNDFFFVHSLKQFWF